MKKIYLVTGATGHLGNTLVAKLLERGECVRALTLAGEKGIRHSGALYYEGDVRDKESLRAFFSHKDDEELFLIHAAGIISIREKGEKNLRAVNIDGVKNIISLAEENKVKRMIYVSSVHALNERGRDGIIAEAEHYDSECVVGEYAKSKAVASNMILDAVKRGLDASLVLPSGIIGPGDTGRNHLVQLCSAFLSGHLPLAVTGGYDMVDVRDVADGILSALEKGRTGESYILSGHYTTIRELIGYMAAFSGKKTVLCIPIALAKAASPLFSLFAKASGKRPLFTSYSLMTLESKSRFSHEKATMELAYEARDISESVRDMVSYLKKEGCKINRRGEIKRTKNSPQKRFSLQGS